MGNLLSDPAIAEQLGWTFVHSLWLGALIFLVLRISLLSLNAAAARTRYVVCVMGLIALVATPPATFALLEGRFDDPGPLLLEGTGLDSSSLRPAWLQQTLIKLAGFVRHASPSFMAIWLAGVITLSVYHLVGWFRLQRRLINDSRPLRGWRNLVELAERMELPGVRFFESTVTAVPATVGWIKPIVLLPPAVLSGLPVEHIEAIVAHELAHIGRRDYLVNLLQSVAETVMFFHPVTWWISVQIRHEREACCDDIASRASLGPDHYATALVALAEFLQPRPSPSRVIAATGGSLLLRIRRLLPLWEEPLARRSLRRPAMGFVLSAAVVTIGATQTLGSAMGVRPVRPLNDVASLAAKVYDLLELPAGKTSMLPALEESVEALRARSFTADQARKLAAALHAATPEDLTAAEVPLVSVADPLAHQYDPAWKYGTFFERLALARHLWNAAHARVETAPEDARCLARGALLLAAQDSPLFGASGLRHVITRPDFVEVARLSPREHAKLRRHVDDHLTVTRAFVRELAELEALLAKASSKEDVVRRGFAKLAKMAHQRIDIQIRIVALGERLAMGARGARGTEHGEMLFTELLAELPSGTSRQLAARSRAAGRLPVGPSAITHENLGRFRVPRGGRR